MTIVTHVVANSGIHDKGWPAVYEQPGFLHWIVKVQDLSGVLWDALDT